MYKCKNFSIFLYIFHSYTFILHHIHTSLKNEFEKLTYLKIRKSFSSMHWPFKFLFQIVKTIIKWWQKFKTFFPIDDVRYLNFDQKSWKFSNHQFYICSNTLKILKNVNIKNWLLTYNVRQSQHEKSFKKYIQLKF